jgi:hypothetical protein
MDNFEYNIALIERAKKAQELIAARQSQGLKFPQMELREALRQDNIEVMRELHFVQK